MSALLCDQEDVDGGRVDFIKERESRDTALTRVNTTVQLSYLLRRRSMITRSIEARTDKHIERFKKKKKNKESGEQTRSMVVGRYFLHFYSN